MDHAVADKEESRLMLARAAIDIAGRQGDFFLMDAPLDEARRCVLFAVPEAEAPGCGCSFEELDEVLSTADVPYLVDWNPDSPTFGLKYVPDFMTMPEDLRTFTQDAARAIWQGWRSKMNAQTDLVVDLALEMTGQARPVEVSRDMSLPLQRREVTRSRTADER